MIDSICKNGAIRCMICGRFMGTKDLEEGEMSFTPDAYGSHEAVEWEHKACAAISLE